MYLLWLVYCFELPPKSTSSANNAEWDMLVRHQRLVNLRIKKFCYDVPGKGAVLQTFFTFVSIAPT